MKRGRKRKDNNSKREEFLRGYHCGWERVKREAEGMRPKQKKKGNHSKEYEEGLKAGTKAAKKAYGSRR